VDRVVSAIAIPPPATPALSGEDEIRRDAFWRARAAAIRLVLTDCDGVLTDGSVSYSHRGEQARRFNVRDGMGVTLLNADGIEVGIVSGEGSQSIRRRAEKLHITILGLGVQDKLGFVRSLAADKGYSWMEIAYIGDDVNDLELMEEVFRHGGITGAPPDAAHQIIPSVHIRMRAHGGAGAFREFADRLLELRGAAVRPAFSTASKEDT
jgi:3-deoxy-D-manno-octulosonate 8-phosphate phosphatase (KDO 8-P phosphatase)